MMKPAHLDRAPLVDRCRPDRAAIEAAILEHRGNVVRSAAALSISATWLHGKLVEYGLVERARLLRLAYTGRRTGRPGVQHAPSPEAIRAAWIAYDGNVRAIARAIGVSRGSIRHAVKGLGLQVGKGRTNRGGGVGTQRAGSDGPTGSQGA